MQTKNKRTLKRGIACRLPVNNLPGIWNDPYHVAADDDVDDVDVDSGEGHFPLSQSSLKLYFPLYNFFGVFW